MADDAFNGAVACFPSTTSGDILGPLRSISFSESGARADMTGASDSDKTYKVGISDAELSVTVVGGLATTLSVGASGALAVTWGDAGSATVGTLAAAEIAGITTDGAMDGETTSTLTFVKSAG